MNRSITGRTDSRVRGFSLIEIMIVVAIMAILVAIAVPTYDYFVTKARRADAMNMLHDAAQHQQRFFTLNGTFTATIGTGGLGMSNTSRRGYYSLSVTATATTYSLTATRVSPQTSDTDCGDFTLNHLGVEGVVNATQSAGMCW